MQVIYSIIHSNDLKDICKMSPLDIFICMLSGAAHDMDHPGNNNVFETKCKSKLALLYNDYAVLENHHTASLFFLLDNILTDCNIFQGFTAEDYAFCRKNIIDNIMGTDMSKHGTS
jgi:cAMP-specific phosphodiesterase 4